MPQLTLSEKKARELLAYLDTPAAIRRAFFSLTERAIDMVFVNGMVVRMNFSEDYTFSNVEISYEGTLRLTNTSIKFSDDTDTFVLVFVYNILNQGSDFTEYCEQLVMEFWKNRD